MECLHACSVVTEGAFSKRRRKYAESCSRATVAAVATVAGCSLNLPVLRFTDEMLLNIS